MAGLAPTYKNVAAFKSALSSALLDSRDDYLKHVKYATLLDPSPYPKHPSSASMIFAQHFNVVQSRHECPECGEAYTLKHKKDSDGNVRWIWRGPRYLGSRRLISTRIKWKLRARESRRCV